MCSRTRFTVVWLVIDWRSQIESLAVLVCQKAAGLSAVHGGAMHARGA
jgi:hypothetical protein